MIASAFALQASYPVPALGLTVRHYRHACGAEHWHLGAQDDHRAFVVAVRTPPADSTGLPHILEHLALCGSHRYPVRDPFFQMLRRSLQTFMNAMTFPDLTAYPFASQVAKDYDNLLAVYLDAVFAPTLHRLDYAQEGHRLEPEGERWQRKGVVYNEMKGAMDSTDAQLEQARERLLLPDTIYRHNAGGEPVEIPRLRYEDLVAFHRRCYRPANACFVTYGNEDPARLHAAFAAYIGEDPGQPLPPPAPSRLHGPLPDATIPVPLAPGQDPLDATATSITWVQGDCASLDEVLEGELLERLLLGHAGAPLRRALEGSGLGRSTGHSGYSSSYRSGLFTAELDGISEEDYARLPPLVEETLRTVVAQGFPASEVDAALHQLELARREISGDHYPFGLELCFRIIGPWNYGADPLPFLDQSAAIERLRARRGTPAAAIALVRERLLDNPRRLVMRAHPDLAFHQRATAAEQAQIEQDLRALDAAGKAALAEQARALATRQASHDDPAVLPDLALADVPPQRRWASGTTDGDCTRFLAGTNGLVHELVAFDMPALSEHELALLPLAERLIGGVGVGAYRYDEQAARINQVCGGMWAWSDIVADPEDETRARGLFCAEIKGLASRAGSFLPLLSEAVQGCRTDELARLRELVEETLGRLQGSVSHRGNRLAARAAMRGLRGAAGFPHRIAGLGSLAFLKHLSAAIAEEAPGSREALAQLGRELAALFSRLIGGQRALAVIGAEAELREAVPIVAQAWALPNPLDTASTIPLQALPAQATPPTAYLTATAVSYCALSFPAVGLEHPDAAALAVLGPLLTNNLLHPKLREQGGAYGGGASYQATTATVSLTSYRDPRLDATIADMRESLASVARFAEDRRLLKEAVLSVIAQIDAPASPAGEARNRFVGDRKGSGPTLWNAHRARVLAITPEQVRAAAATYLPPTGGTLAVITGQEQVDKSRLEWTREAI